MLKCCGKILCAHCKLSKVIALCSTQDHQFPGSYYLLFLLKPVNKTEIYYDYSLFMKMFPFKTNPSEITLQLMNQVVLTFDLARIIGFSSLLETPMSLIMK